MQRYDLLSPTLAVPPFALHMQGPEVIDGRMVRSDHWLSFCFPFILPVSLPPRCLPASRPVVCRSVCKLWVVIWTMAGAGGQCRF